MPETLKTLIQRIEDGTATAAELDQARAMLDAFAWSEVLPTEAEVSLAMALAVEAAEIDVSGAVLADIGAAVDPIGDAVRDAAGTVDIVAGVMAQLDEQGALPVSEALVDEAGAFDAAAAVLAALDLDAGVPVARAVLDEAGGVDVVAGVMAELEADLAPVGQAVHDAAGDIDIADAVMASLAAPSAMPAAVGEAPKVGVAANNTTRWFAAMLAAAMVALVLGLGGYLGGGPAAPSTGVVNIASGDGDTDALPEMAPELMFASASEVQIEDLSFGDDVVVFQDEGDDGALILWVDEEVL